MGGALLVRLPAGVLDEDGDEVGQRYVDRYAQLIGIFRRSYGYSAQSDGGVAHGVSILSRPGVRVDPGTGRTLS